MFLSSTWRLIGSAADRPTSRSSPKTWIGKKELEATLLISLRQKEGCSDIADLCVYRCGNGRWTIGHIRLGSSRNCNDSALGLVERQFAKVFLLLQD